MSRNQNTLHPSVLYFIYHIMHIKNHIFPARVHCLYACEGCPAIWHSSIHFSAIIIVLLLRYLLYPSTCSLNITTCFSVFSNWFFISNPILTLSSSLHLFSFHRFSCSVHWCSLTETVSITAKTLKWGLNGIVLPKHKNYYFYYPYHKCDIQ